MSQHCDIDTERLTDCLIRNTAAIQKRIRKFPDRSHKSITKEFMQRCREHLGLAEPRPKHRLLRFLGSLL